MPVAFPEGQTGSTLLLDALVRARQAHPAVFSDVVLPDSASAFKRAYSDVLVGFEARRVASGERVAVARTLAAVVAERAQFGEHLLTDAVQTDADPGVPEVIQGTASPGWSPRVEYGGRTWEWSEFTELADRLRADHQLTNAAADALRWVAGAFSGPIDLTGQRFVVLGANAELAPTPHLLAAGARVAWVDRAAPSGLAPDQFAGAVVTYPHAGDLLADTPAVRAAVEAEGAPHLGMYAYAPGRGRELLLTAAMNAIATAVEPASVALLVSPTTPGQVAPEDQADRAVRHDTMPFWQRMLFGSGALGGAPVLAHDGVEIVQSLVPLQGATYQAAQYLTKMMVAEVWAADRAPMRVSANVAGITHTKSLEHPLFLAGFLGAPRFGIHVYEPEQTRVLTTLMMLHDVLRPDAPAASADAGEVAQAQAVTAQAIHGGLRSAPFELNGTIRVAAMMGLAQRPSLLLRRR